jgi:hypothetical protein
MALDARDEFEVVGIDSRGLHVTYPREAVDSQIPSTSQQE